MHLEAASSIVQGLIARYVNLPTYPSAIVSEPVCSRPIISYGRPTSVDEISRNFFIGVFCWFDIISSASTRSEPRIGGCVELLEADGCNIQLDKMMGCENWALISIAKISKLALWRTEREERGLLSMVELFNRAAHIESALKRGLAENLRSAELTGPIASKRAVSIITRIFASSALTYLHIVTYGAKPELHEIRDSVSMSITALTELPDPLLLRNIVWPFCVTGCMALKEQESAFSDLIIEAKLDVNTLGAEWKVFTILKECWKGRGRYSQVADGWPWCSAMSRLGYKVLLV